MLKRLKRLLTARAIVLGLILALTAAMGAAVVIPQSRPGAGALTGSAAGRLSVVRLLGLDHVFSTWWFASLSSVFVVSLILSTIDQFALSRARMRQPPSPGGGGVALRLSPAMVEQVVASEGYRRVASGPAGTRHVRFWLGYWGTSLLHAGMTVAAIFALVYVLTEHRLLLRVESGVTAALDPGTLASRRGFLARPLPIPATVRLYALTPEFGVEDHLVDLGSALVFTDAGGDATDVRVAINDLARYRGLRVYQRNAFGHAFVLELRSAERDPFAVTLQLGMPRRRDEPSYGELALDGTRALLKAKYFANADRRTLLPSDPELTLRLYEGDRLRGELSLRRGQSGRLGPYEVRLADVAWWTEILFEGSRGTAGIFAGFALLLAGSALTFVSIPREVVVRPSESGSTVKWRATRFAELYEQERERILARCKELES